MMKRIFIGGFLILALIPLGKLKASRKDVKGAAQVEKAVSAIDFLNSIGVNSSISKRGENLQNTIDHIKYLGIRWIRTGYEDNISLDDLKRLHDETGVRFSYGLLSGGHDIERLIKDAVFLASEKALLAIEGPNEPNNWGIPYQGKKGGAKDSWLPIARLQRDLYQAVKSSPQLKSYPVFHLTENGAQTDNAGLQFLEIPTHAGTLMPAGTRYADYANCHNYVSHPSWPGIHDNQTWLSADPSRNCPVDGLYGNYGSTWGKHFSGYTEENLVSLPKVTTETGIAISENEGITEEMQACLYANLYLSQFKRGWKHTAVYLLRTRSDEAAHEVFSFFNLDGTPKLAAHYLHNLTTVLADKGTKCKSGKLAFEIENEPETVHHQLLRRSDGTFFLVLWGERYTGGTNSIHVRFGKRCRQLRFFDIAVGSEAIEVLHDSSVCAITMTNHPMIIEIEK